MRAWRLDRQAPVTEGPLRLEELPVPEPQAGEVLVEIAACGICRTDLHVVEGDLPLRRTPTIPGHQVVGRVLQAGPGVTSVAVGDRVGVAWLHRADGRCRFCTSGRENLCPFAEFTGWTVPGGFATHIVAPAAFIYPLPPNLSD